MSALNHWIINQFYAIETVPYYGGKMKLKNVKSTVNLEIATPEEVLNLIKEGHARTLKKNVPRMPRIDSCK